MIKPKRLKPGDRVAVVSLSWGGLGDSQYYHKYQLAQQRLEQDFGLEVACMPHALQGSEFIYQHPELRAQDLMDAFRDDSIAGIFCAIGGDDTIRLLPFIDFQVIKANPKIFIGFSDSTINHFMMYHVGLVSFYGPSIMSDFAEYVRMCDYTKNSVDKMLFTEFDRYQLLPSKEWSADYIPWSIENINTELTMIEDEKGYEIINGHGVASGHLLGGCIDVFMMVVGTSIWPSLDEWTDAILFIETSEDKPSPDFIIWTFRNLAALGILKRLKGILVGKPQGEVFYEEYKQAIKTVLVEEKLEELIVFYNVNFGHAKPIATIPYGIKVELNSEERSITLLECPTS